jgi:hypothetical protein
MSGKRSMTVAALMVFCRLSAQQLEPRNYSISPVGTNIVVLGYTRQSGDVLFDPSLPITDLNARLNAFVLGYARTLSLLGRSANFRVALPYVAGHLSGTVAGEPGEIYRSGLADLAGSFSVNLYGAPSLRPSELGAFRPSTSVWASVSTVFPTGQYDPNRIVNPGLNRWALKPELAVIQPIGRWMLETYGGAWFYTANSSFRGKLRKEEGVLGAYQAHLSYTLRPGLWVAANSTLYHGGLTRVDGLSDNDRQFTFRLGGTVSIPLKHRQSLKFQYAKTLLANRGGQFNQYQVAYAWVWFDPHRR